MMAAAKPDALDEFDRVILAVRGVYMDMARAAFLQTVNDESIVAKLVKWRKWSYGPVMAIPFFDANGEPVKFGQFRPHSPRIDRRGKSVKYETPKGSKCRLYLPPNVRAAVLADKSIPLVITEGPIKALAGASHGYHMAALCGVWNFGKARGKDDDGKNIGPIELHDDFSGIALEGRVIIIIFDSDAVSNENVRAAEVTLAKLLTERGAIVKIGRVPAEEDGTKNGLDDYLIRHGKEALDKVIAEAKPPAATAKPIVYIQTDEHRTTHAVLEHLADDPNLYYQNGPVRLAIDDESGGAVICPVVSADMRRRITERCTLGTINDKDEFKPKHVPDWVVQQTHCHPDPPAIRRIVGVSGVPILRADGSIHNRPGYDAATRLYYHATVDVPKLGKLTREDAVTAMTNLLDIVADFPFADDAGRSVWVAIPLTIMGRHLTPGSVPAALVTANVAGSGKGKLATTGIQIATGMDAAGQSLDADSSEVRKLLTAVVQKGSPYLLFDNLPSGSMIRSAVLDMAITNGRHHDRLLGTNELVELPFRPLILATGNNVVCGGDAARRWLTITLNSPIARPEDRNDFRHKSLEAHVRQDRGRYVADALTILAAYIQAGRPDMQLGSTGSFQDWSDLVRSAIVWAGGADPWATVIARRYLADAESSEHLSLVAAWEALDPDCRGLSVASAKRIYDVANELVKKTGSYADDAAERAARDERIAKYTAVDELIAEAGIKGFDAKWIGYMLRRFKDRPTTGGRRIMSRPGHGGTMVWRISAPATQWANGGDGGNGGDVFPNKGNEVKKSNSSNSVQTGPGTCPPSSPSPPLSQLDFDYSAIKK